MPVCHKTGQIFPTEENNPCFVVADPMKSKRVIKQGIKPRQGQDIFVYSTTSRLALQPTQPPTQWVLGALSPGISGRVVNLTTHLHPVLRSRIVKLYLYFPIIIHGD
jgi:hypothetical protein